MRLAASDTQRINHPTNGVQLAASDTQRLNSPQVQVDGVRLPAMDAQLINRPTSSGQMVCEAVFCGMVYSLQILPVNGRPDPVADEISGTLLTMEESRNLSQLHAVKNIVQVNYFRITAKIL